MLPPKNSLAYIEYFCGNPENEDDLKNNETKRTALYKLTAALIRAYANIADELEEAGYTKTEIEYIKNQVDFYFNLREEIKNASGEKLDTKTYEADMRHLIDTYIVAEDSQIISDFENQTLLELIEKLDLSGAIDTLPPGIKNNPEAVAETIINNIRQKIIQESLIDPAYFEEMSKLLNEIIKERRAQAQDYKTYLKKITELAKKVKVEMLASIVRT